MSEVLTENEIMQIIQGLGAQYQMAIVGMLVTMFIAIAIGIAWFVYERFFTPDESKYIRKAFRKKQPLLFLGGDDGFCDIHNAPFSGSEGALRTADQGKTKEHYLGILPRPKTYGAEDITPFMAKDKATNNDSVKKTVALANYISMIANRRLLLRGARVPVWIGYRGKAIITSLYGLVALQILETLVEDSKKEAQDMKDKAKAEMEKSLSLIFATVDILAIKALFSRQWNQSQIIACETDAERAGEVRSKKFGSKESLMMFFGVMICLVVLVIILFAAAYYLK